MGLFSKIMAGRGRRGGGFGGLIGRAMGSPAFQQKMAMKQQMGREFQPQQMQQPMFNSRFQQQRMQQQRAPHQQPAFDASVYGMPQPSGGGMMGHFGPGSGMVPPVQQRPSPMMFGGMMDRRQQAMQQMPPHIQQMMQQRMMGGRGSFGRRGGFRGLMGRAFGF